MNGAYQTGSTPSIFSLQIDLIEMSVSLLWRHLVNFALHPLQSVAQYSLYNCVHLCLYAPKRSLINANLRITQPGGQQQHIHVHVYYFLGYVEGQGVQF